MVLRERENETELLSAALDRASGGRGALLAFSGPFGICLLYTSDAADE